MRGKQLRCGLMVAAAVYATITGCAAAARPPVGEFLDERTGTNMTVVHRALTFAAERSTLAAHARDYVSLAAVEVDRSGTAQLYLIGYFWSTIDRRKVAAAHSGTGRLIELFADGRLIRLRPEASLPRDLDATPSLLAPAASHFDEAAYPVSWEILSFIAGSRVLVLRLADHPLDEDEEADSYPLWTDARDDLRAFTQRIGVDR